MKQFWLVVITKRTFKKTASIRSVMALTDLIYDILDRLRA